MAAVSWKDVRKRPEKNNIRITGSARKRIVSDLIQWSAAIEAKAPERTAAYLALKSGTDKAVAFLKAKGVAVAEVQSLPPNGHASIRLAAMKYTSLQTFGLLMSMVGAMAGPLPVVAIQPLGRVKPEDVARVQAGIRALYAVDVEVLPVTPLPKTAYYPPRERYRAEKLLDSLELEIDKRFMKVIGLTTRDISTSKDDIEDWGIFGLGELGGRSCVVSTFRLRAGEATGPVFHTRLVKVVNHELGHTFGLGHCPAAGCLMQDAGGKIATVDGESGKPCPACAARLPLVE